jgi:hypothetical protein
MRESAQAHGIDKLATDKVDAEIQAVRQERRAR